MKLILIDENDFQFCNGHKLNVRCIKQYIHTGIGQ